MNERTKKLRDHTAAVLHFAWLVNLGWSAGAGAWWYFAGSLVWGFIMAFASALIMMEDAA